MSQDGRRSGRWPTAARRGVLVALSVGVGALGIGACGGGAPNARTTAAAAHLPVASGPAEGPAPASSSGPGSSNPTPSTPGGLGSLPATTPSPRTAGTPTTARTSATTATVAAPVTPTTPKTTGPTTTAARPALAPRRVPPASEVNQVISTLHGLLPLYTPTAAQLATIGDKVCTAFDQGQTFAQVRGSLLSFAGAAAFAAFVPLSASDTAVRTLVGMYCPLYGSKLV